VALLVKDEDAVAVGIFTFLFRHGMRKRLLRRLSKKPAVFVKLEAFLEIPA
jgi:hypothetical protein